jgi:hypothetical protein
VVAQRQAWHNAAACPSGAVTAVRAFGPVGS